jgi:hypothetical protein
MTAIKWLTLGLLSSSVLFCSCSEKKSEPHPKPQPPQAPLTLEQYAADLRKRHDSVHIYAVENHYEVWSLGALKGKWKEAQTLEEARKVVDDYYLEWARACIGPTIPGVRIE